MLGPVVFLWAVALLGWPGVAAGAEGPRSKPVEGATSHLDVAYLPDRVVGAYQDRWVKLDVHVPPGEGPFPCVVYVHGGGYGAGDKADVSRELLARTVREGYVAVSLNYILRGPSREGIFPQVYLDYKDAIRFLRSNASTYHIDPCRMGAVGFSAGGWLSGSASFTTADDTVNVWAKQYNHRGERLHVRTDNPRTAYPEQSSRLSAIATDFWPRNHYPFYSLDDPAVLAYVGTDATHELIKRAAPGQDAQQVVLTDARYKGKHTLHTPPYDAQVNRLYGDAGNTLEDQVFAFLHDKLVANPRLVPPEARPIQRVFAQTAEVALVACGDGVSMYYTLDGSEPGITSTRYEKPFTLDQTTTVKAIAVKAGLLPSAVGSFTFTRGTPPPTITGPEELPVATVGRPYAVTFTTGLADDAPIVWNLGGHVMPDTKMHAPDIHAVLGLTLDAKSGVLSGTPTQPGAWTVQVQAAHGPGQVADVWTRVLRINPAAGQ